MMQLLIFTDAGIYCPSGDFYIDPWKKVKCAIITHAHSDHARYGSTHYITHNLSLGIMRYRLGNDISIRGYNYNETFTINGVKVSLHPAGHIIGSSQIRVESNGVVWVVSGDYKLSDDGISTPFEPVKCHVFISESTFGLPIFNWKSQKEVFSDINKWWSRNATDGRASVIIGYSLGKAQRILQNVNHTIGPIFTHGAVENVLKVFREDGITLAKTTQVSSLISKQDYRNALIIAPSSALGSKWIYRFEPYSVGIASGWMTLRGSRRRQNADLGFVLSDHADWNELSVAIKATGAEKVYVTHGYTSSYVKWLREQGWDADEVKTQFTGEAMEANDEFSE